MKRSLYTILLMAIAMPLALTFNLQSLKDGFNSMFSKVAKPQKYQTNHHGPIVGNWTNATYFTGLIKIPLINPDGGHAWTANL